MALGKVSPICFMLSALPGFAQIPTKETLDNVNDVQYVSKTNGKTLAQLTSTLPAGTDTFSVCLGRAPASAGNIVWNDETRKGQDGVQEVAVSGNSTWTVSLKNLKLRKNGVDYSVGCETGCAAVLDLSSSLFAVPNNMYTTFAHHLSALGITSCTDLTSFPDLVMELGGQLVTLPPSAYLGTFFSDLSSEVQSFMHPFFINEEKSACQLLLMDMGAAKQTALGALVVLGMPFFREYYTTFTSYQGRKVFLAPASSGCEPDVGGLINFVSSGATWRTKPRSVNSTSLSVPSWTKSSIAL